MVLAMRHAHVVSCGLCSLSLQDNNEKKEDKNKKKDDKKEKEKEPAGPDLSMQQGKHTPPPPPPHPQVAGSTCYIHSLGFIAIAANTMFHPYGVVVQCRSPWFQVLLLCCD